MSYKGLFSKKSAQPENSKYPKWELVRKDLSYLPKGMLSALEKAMIFIVNEDGKEHAAVIVRADNSEFQSPVTAATPVRLYIGFYSGQIGDIFSVYPLVFDNPREPFYKETWVKPYEDREGIEQSDPLSTESRKRLQLIFSQEYTWMLFVDNQHQINFVRKVYFTKDQRKTFKQYLVKLDDYEGMQVSKLQYITLLQEYLNTVPLQKLLGEFLTLLRS